MFIRSVSVLATAFVLLMQGCASKAVAPAVAEMPNFDGSPASNDESMYRPVVGTGGMVSSDDQLANEWGAEILRKGGNAVDAAVATAFMLAVTRPGYASLGGGGFLLYCPPGADCEALDYREVAPKAATRDMYLRNGKADSKLSEVGALAVGVPGTPAGLAFALKRWGTMSLVDVLRRPIEVARKGFRMTGYLEYAGPYRWKDMNDEARRVYGCAGKPCAAGALIRQPDLAHVLESIASRGDRAFYEGYIARKIAEGVKAAGGILSQEDLKAYKPKLRAPIRGSYKGYEVIAMPPPSAGGSMVVQLLGYFERAEKQGLLTQGYGAAASVHATAHALALSFADRAEIFGDPDFVSVPLAQFLSPAYLDERWRTFDPERAAVPEKPGIAFNEGSQTTHFSVIDRKGGAVGITTTLNRLLGAAFVPPGTGVFLNDEMDDFSTQPGVPNHYGLVGSTANAIAPGKKPLSSMSPVILRDPKAGVRLVIGAQGGPRITSSTAQVILNRFGYGFSLSDSVAAPRIHEQWKPPTLKFETPGFSPDTVAALQALGYAAKAEDGIAKVHAIERFPGGRVWGVADPRGEGVPVAE